MSEWPLVGRGRELARVAALLDGSDYQGVVIAGPPGVGKTRLAVECLHHAEDTEMATARVIASRATAGLPFGALAPLLPAADHPSVGGVDDRADLLRRSALALKERARGHRFALMVDDAQLLDDASATLVQQLAATNAAFVLATVRTVDPAPEPVVALWKDGLAERIELGGLQAEAIEELLAKVLGGPVDRAAALQLAVRSQGNALYLRELVLGAMADDALREEGGIWRLVGPLAPSARLIELVEARLAGLSPAERDLLEVVSFGEPLGSAELTALTDPMVAEILERKALLSSTMNGRRLELRLAQAIYRDVLRARIPVLRERVISRTLADVVEGTGARRREDTLRVATWRLSGGGARPELLLAGARTARWRYDFELAGRLAQAAIDAGAGFDAALLAAQLAALKGQVVEAEAKLAPLATSATDDAERARVALAQLNTAMYLGQFDRALQLAGQAETAITDQRWRNEITAGRAAFLFNSRGPAAAAELAEPLLAHSEGAALVTASMIATCSLDRLGRCSAALAASERGYQTQLVLPEPMDWYPWYHLFLRGRALSNVGRFEEAEVLATAQHHQALVEASAEAQAMFGLLLARVAVDRGHVRRAVRFGQEAVALFRQLGRPMFTGVAMVTLALAHGFGGRTEEASTALSAVDALGLDFTFDVRGDLLRARAWIAGTAGDLPRGVRLLEEAATAAQSAGDRIGVTEALHDLARLGRARDAAPQLVALAEQMEGDLASARAAHAEAITQPDPDRLAEISATFEAMGADLLAAEATADAAVACRKAGDPKRAADAERRAATLAQRCEGAATPALQAIETRARLTTAERETALLAAAGRSNKQIADELCLSIRTVETRLQHVYDKLGISSRGELAEVLDASSK